MEEIKLCIKKVYNGFFYKTHNKKSALIS